MGIYSSGVAFVMFLTAMAKPQLHNSKKKTPRERFELSRRERQWLSRPPPFRTRLPRLYVLIHVALIHI